MKIPENVIRDIYYNDYCSGMSLESVAIKYNITSNYFSRWFKKLNLPTRSNKINSAKYHYDSSIFESVDTPEKAYWLGFLSSDGFIQSKRKHSSYKVGISLAKQDENHLYKFRDFIHGDMPIKTYECKVGYRPGAIYSKILITGDKFAEDLIKHGVVEHKSEILLPPNIDTNLRRHYIRGYFDGDGSIWSQTNSRGVNKQYSASFIGTESVLKFIQSELMDAKVIKRLYPMNPRHEGDSVLQFKFGGNKTFGRFMEYIYSNATVYLDRKFEKYKEFTQFMNSRS